MIKEGIEVIRSQRTTVTHLRTRKANYFFLLEYAAIEAFSVTRCVRVMVAVRPFVSTIFMTGNGSPRKVYILAAEAQRPEMTGHGKGLKDAKWLLKVYGFGWMVVDGMGKNEWMIATEKPPQSSSSKKIGRDEKYLSWLPTS